MGMQAHTLERIVKRSEDRRQGRHREPRVEEKETAARQRPDLPDWHEVEERLLRVTERMPAR